MRLHIIANWMQGNALSGGDRIFIELSKRLSRDFEINLYLSEEGWRICKREGLEGFNYAIWAKRRFTKFGYFVDYPYRSINSIINSFKLKINKDDIVYSSSDFLPDSIPAFILKLRFGVKWIAGFYLFAPVPWHKESPYKGKRFFIGLFYWIAQLPVYLIIKKFADMVFVTSDPNINKFITIGRGRNKIMAINGGVDISYGKKYLLSSEYVHYNRRKYDGCFVGRFHPQKGILELVDIWKELIKYNNDSKLAIIGGGPLGNELKLKIKVNGLEKNIEVFNYLDGEEKYSIFRQSKLFMYPAILDHWSIAPVEAMAFGIPVVSFDLSVLNGINAKGILKVPCYNIKEFAERIVTLLNNGQLYESLSNDAFAWAEKCWDWGKRVDSVKSLILDK